MAKFNSLFAIAFFALFILGAIQEGLAQSEGYKNSERNELDTSNNWSYHFQFTTTYQEHGPFKGGTSLNGGNPGPNSFHAAYEHAQSMTTTLFLGRKLWEGASLYFNPEVAGGEGLSGVYGTGSPFNGETFKIGNIAPTPYVARAYVRQYFKLNGNSYEDMESDKNQTKDHLPDARFVIDIGKFCLADFFDDNKYAHDPRAQFMNWSLMNNTSWDFAANTRGYTSGIVLELIHKLWAIRFSSAMVPTVPNGPNMDLNVFKGHSETFEYEHRLFLRGHKGKIRALIYCTFDKSPTYLDAMNAFKKGDSSLANVINGSVERYTYGGEKYGIGVSYDQELTKDLAVFARAGWADGHSAIWAFTEVDHGISAGVSIKMDLLKRPYDIVGIGGVVNGISQDHRNYLAAGATTFNLGDGSLAHYGPEEIIEAYYSFHMSSSLDMSLDYQFMANPGYNRDRGPVNVYGLRLHVDF